MLEHAYYLYIERVHNNKNFLKTILRTGYSNLTKDILSIYQQERFVSYMRVDSNM